MFIRVVKFVLVTCSLVASSIAGSADKSFDWHFNVPAVAGLIVDTDGGAIEIRGHPGREIVIHAAAQGSERFISDVNIRAQESSSGVQVVARTGGSRWFDNLFRIGSSSDRLHFTIDVPQDCSIELRTRGGGLDVTNVAGSLRGFTSGGRIKLADVSGSVTMRTYGGSVRGEQLRGTVKLRTFGGSIWIAGAVGDLDVQTSGGSIRLDGIDARLRAETGAGHVIAQMRSNHGISLHSSSGSITLLLPPGTRASMDAETSIGRVSSSIPLTTTQIADRSRLRGSINGGGDKISLSTFRGRISITSTDAS